MKTAIAIALLALAAGSTPAFAQADFSGVWQPRYHEDQVERLPGPELRDYVGLPINDSARQAADTWDPSRITLPEEQCRVHVSPYILRGPLNVRMWEEKHPKTQDLLAIKLYSSTYEQTRTIWMDGRAHPGPNAGHTWMGFSTGRWIDDTLVVTTTHIKQMWHRRNGLPQSDKVRLTEYFTRHGDVLNYVTYTDDPVYLTEPLVKTTNLRYAARELTPQQLLYPCQNVVEVDALKRGQVPHYMPGENPFLKEFQEGRGIPAIAARGGAETMYPEFQARVKAALAGNPPR